MRRALLIDLGHSRVKWQCWELASGCRPLGPPESVPLEAMAAVDWGRVGAGVEQIGLLATGPGEMRRQLVSALVDARDAATLPVFELTAAAAWGGLRNGYDDGTRLGVDRWAALMAAWGSGLAPACIVGAGTVWTVDWLDADGRHHAGPLWPGRRLYAHAMARLPVLAAQAQAMAAEAEVGRWTRGPGSDFEVTSTAAALRLGWDSVLLALDQWLLEHPPEALRGLTQGAKQGSTPGTGQRMAGDERDGAGVPLNWLVHGGDASAWASCARRWRQVPELALHGLALAMSSREANGPG